MRGGRLVASVAWVCLWAGMAGAQTIVNPNGDITVRTGGTFESVVMLDTGAKRAFVGQPYSAKVTTTEEFYPRDGKVTRRVREERDFRDAEGRERFEQGVERNGSFEVGTVRLANPVEGFGAGLDVRNKVARVTHYTPSHQTAADVRITRELHEKLLAKQAARADRPLLETLPEKMIAGVRAEGVRETYTIPAGREGNAADVRIVVEIWTSPELKIVMASSLDDPRSRKQTVEVSELVRGEPDGKLFQVPADYEVVDAASGAVTSPH